VAAVFSSVVPAVGTRRDHAIVRISEFLDQAPEPLEAWPTGLSSLDELVAGFSRGQSWVITGPPGSGKSTLLTQFVFSLAVNHGITTDYFCSRVDAPDLPGQG
jgi:replicative DNA helicase